MNQLPSVFIGSSSEGFRVAEIVHGLLNSHLRAYLWKHGLFAPSSHPMESLEREIKLRQFAVIIGTPDDPILKRGELSESIRDNLLFELGLFMGALGRNRTYLVVPDNAKLSIPSDIIGLGLIRYDAARFALGPQDQLAAMHGVCLELRNTIESTWSQMREEQQKKLRVALSSERFKAIRRLYSVIIELRDLLIVFPGQILDSLSDRQRFEQVKQRMAQKVESIAQPFREDAASAGLTREFEGLLDATRLAVTGFPYPEEVLITQPEAIETLSTLLTSLAGQVMSGGSPLKELNAAIDSEIERRATSVSERYANWWRTSHKSLQAATKQLLDALMVASLDLNSSLILESSTSRGLLSS